MTAARPVRAPGAVPGPPARAGFALALGLVLASVATMPFARTANAAEGDPAAGWGHAVAGEHEASGHEAPAEGRAIDGKKLALQLLNFGVLVFILVKLGGGAINKALAARHEQLKADLTAAAELRAAAEANLAKQEARLGSLEQEIAELRRAIKAEAEAEKARLIAAAEERAARIRSETAFLVEQQVREAEIALRRESVNAALTAAEEILRRSIGSADQRSLMDTFLADVERPSAQVAPPQVAPAPAQVVVAVAVAAAGSGRPV